MKENLGISDVKAKFSAICDQAADGEVICFTRQRGNRIEHFELRRAAPSKRQLGAWQGQLPAKAVDALSAPLTQEELDTWSI